MHSTTIKKSFHNTNIIISNRYVYIKKNPNISLHIRNDNCNSIGSSKAIKKSFHNTNMIISIRYLYIKKKHPDNCISEMITVIPLLAIEIQLESYILPTLKYLVKRLVTMYNQYIL